MSMLFPPIGQMPEPGEKPHPRGLVSMLEQGRWWKTRDADWTRVKDMRPTHRANAAALLMRQAPTLVERITMAEGAVLMRWLLAGVDVSEFVLDDMERERGERKADPQAWMASTKLYRSLIRPRRRDAERFGTPCFPEGTPEYAAYRKELRVELGKFARGEHPYPYVPEPGVRPCD